MHLPAFRLASLAPRQGLRLLPALVFCAALLAGCILPARHGQTRFAGRQLRPLPAVGVAQIQDAPGDFTFAVLADNSGGTRPGVLEHAVGDLNRLRPAFVLGIGDMIEGYTTDTTKAELEWEQYDAIVGRLAMPLFRLPGNHDVTNPVLVNLWTRRYGPSYYHFIYKDVLFLMLDCETYKEAHISDAEQAWVKQTLAQTKSKVAWTFVLMHKPLWDMQEDSGWAPIEEQLKGRPHTVIAGHRHRYKAYERDGMHYYQLGTAGGVIDNPPKPGQLDHLFWVTMRAGRPSFANLKLDGVLDDRVLDAPAPAPAPATGEGKTAPTH